MDRTRITEVFNLGFREGANERARRGIPRGGNIQAPADTESPHKGLLDPIEEQAWKEGFQFGYTVGASDSELASVEIPGAQGMFSGVGEEMLEMFGFFAKLSEP